MNCIATIFLAQRGTLTLEDNRMNNRKYNFRVWVGDEWWPKDTPRMVKLDGVENRFGDDITTKAFLDFDIEDGKVYFVQPEKSTEMKKCEVMQGLGKAAADGTELYEGDIIEFVFTPDKRTKYGAIEYGDCGYYVNSGAAAFNLCQCEDIKVVSHVFVPKPSDKA